MEKFYESDIVPFENLLLQNTQFGPGLRPKREIQSNFVY